jgi:hypothetical protein
MDELMLRPATGMAFFFSDISLLLATVQECSPPLHLFGGQLRRWMDFFSLLPPAGLL